MTVTTNGAGAAPQPNKRRLRVYAFDPAASVELETAVINDAVIELGWEKPWHDQVEVGPVNEYLEVIDYDFPSRTFYEPLDLNDPHLLAQDGLPLSEGRPQFHQQMVFAVAMKTIEDFERALGRPVFWTQPRPERIKNDDGRYYPDFIKRLRIYPHAMRAPNAYYSPAKAALLFGYFKGEPEAPGLDAPWVFTCLSADIIAHETTHAILHGMRRRSVQVANEDSLALHEGFADIVALLQHFTMRKVVEHELARTGGMLRSINLLTGLASQFGRAIGRNGALRQALETLSQEQREHDRAAGAEQRGIKSEQHVKRLADVLEPHDRGQFIVAAVFDAFVTIYERRTADLFRMAGVTPGGKDALPDRLVARLAAEACKSANSILQMCVRGLDYMPPVAPTFGEYLRAIITADTDLYPDDPYKYRVAVAEAFRKRGIPVPGCLSYAPDSLCWDAPDLSGFEKINAAHPDKAFDPNKLLASALGEMIYMPRYGKEAVAETAQHPEYSRKEGRSATRTQQAAFLEYSAYQDPAVGEPNLREEAMRVVLHNQMKLHEWIERADRDPVVGPSIDREWERLLGLRFVPLEPGDPLQSVNCEDKKDDCYVPRRDSEGRRIPKFEVHSVRIARRRTPEGRELQQLIAQVTQNRWGFFDQDEQAEVDAAGPGDSPEPDFWFRGGATIIIDLNDGRLTHIVRKRIDKNERLAQQRRFILGDDAAMAMLADDNLMRLEPFAFMHDHQG